MGSINWQEKLHFSIEQLDEIRNAGYAYIRQGKYNIALPLFEALAILDPQNAYDLLTVGALYLQMNRPELAIKKLEQALAIEKDSAAAKINLAKAYVACEKVDQALAIAKTLKNNPDPFISSHADALLLAYK